MLSESKFQNKYKLIEKLGEGAFGQVFKAREIKTNQIVAVKRIIDCEDSFGGISTTTLREISILNEIDHPNIIKYIVQIKKTMKFLNRFKFVK